MGDAGEGGGGDYVAWVDTEVSGRLTKRIGIYHGGQFDDGFPQYDWPATRTIDWLQSFLLQIPYEYLDSARIVFDTDNQYGESWFATIDIYYERPETDTEVKDRLDRERDKLLFEEDQLKRKLDRLREKLASGVKEPDRHDRVPLDLMVPK